MTTLHSFSGNDGGNPSTGLVQGTDGNFYGTTYDSAPNGGPGTVFQITPAGVLTTLHSFSGSDGGNPLAALTQGSDGNFYGTTGVGGANNGGTVFKLSVAENTTGQPDFFTGETAIGNGVYYLAFSTGNYFGYYSFLSDPAYLYHYDLGYEYVFDAKDGNSGRLPLRLHQQGHFFYTSTHLSLSVPVRFHAHTTVLYYYPDPNNPGPLQHRLASRYFYDFNTLARSSPCKHRRAADDPACVLSTVRTNPRQRNAAGRLDSRHAAARLVPHGHRQPPPSFQNLRRRRRAARLGAPAVRDVNLEVADKEFLVLAGPSGAGKSTLLRLVAGLETPGCRRRNPARQGQPDPGTPRAPARRGGGLPGPRPLSAPHASRKISASP